MPNIGERIKVIRKTEKLSQVEFARSIGVSQGFLSNVEKGRHQPTTDFLIRIANIYPVDANWLLTGERKDEPPGRAAPDPPDQVTLKINQMLADMPEDKRRDVLKYAEEQKLLAEFMADAGAKKRGGAA